MRTLLFRYLLLEPVAPLVLALFLFTFVVLSNQMLRAADVIAGAAIPLPLVLQFLACLLPHLLLITMPMACLLGILLAYGRFAEHYEIQAMLAAGVSYRRVVAPAVVLGFGIGLGMFFWLDATIPRAYRLGLSLRQQLLQSLSAVEIQEGTFIDKFPPYVFYAKEFDKEHSRLRGILVYEMKGQEVERLILAPSGEVRFDPSTRTLWMELIAGTIHEPARAGEDFRLAEFGRLTFAFPVQQLVDKLVGRWLERYPGLSRAQLGRYLAGAPPPAGKQGREAWMRLASEYHRRAALPLACGLVALVAAPMGILMGRGRAAVLFIVSVALIALYYILLASGESLAYQGWLPTAVGVWMPNGVLLAAGLLLNSWVARSPGA